MIKIFPKPGNDPDPVCDKCAEDDERYNTKILGVEIIRKLKKDGTEYSGGDILDPEVRKVYGCKIWLQGKELKVGVGGLYGAHKRGKEYLNHRKNR